MDTFDRAILSSLQTNSRMSTEKLGELVGLSASACQRRIKKLRADGVIEREIAVLNRDKLDGYSTVIVDVILENGGEKILDDFMEILDGEDLVQQYYYTAGEVDFVLIIVTNNMDEYDGLTRRILMSNTNVKKFHSKVAIKSNKLGLKIPL